MIVSYNWLKSLININHSPEDLCKILTDTGLEVEKLHKIESIKGGLHGLVVGEVMTCVAAENSDKLKKTTVDIGEVELLPIVCGAPNVTAGQKVVVATVGTTLYPLGGEPFTIKKAKIRGNVSIGMICAEDEIGLGSSHDGIMVLETEAKAGTPYRDLINLEEDYQIEIGLTPNRGDAASHLGTARDIQAMTNEKIQLPETSNITETSTCAIQVDVKESELCPRYTSILLNNITVKESSDWLKGRLASININPINNVVDVTNYVLHELGQPIHAFDADEIDTGIIVRKATVGEKITTLDDIERELSGVELLICDHNKPLAIAGVFGGKDSGVSQTTTSVFIESAYFDPSVIRKSAKTHGLNTDASFRYERGCDPLITELALKRVVKLLSEEAGATIASKVEDFYPKAFENHTIEFDVKWLNAFCGTSLTTDEVVDIIKRLDIDVINVNGSELTVSVPPYRSEVLRPVDMAEEILRIYGFNQVEIPTRISMTPSVQPRFDTIAFKNKVANYLVSKGFYETMSNSQTKKTIRTPENPVELLNPLSIDQSILRTDMYDGILSSIVHNINRKNKDLLFFEFGRTYLKEENGYKEHQQLILATTGLSTSTNWTTPEKKTDYYFIKGVLEGLAEIIGLPIKKFFKCLEIKSIDSQMKKEFDLKQDVTCAIVNWDLVLERSKSVKFKLNDVPVFPIVSRDLSIVLNSDVEFQSVERIVKEVAGAFFMELSLFNVYEGKNLGDNKKSYAINIKLYDSKQTMTDIRIDKIMEKMIVRLEKEIQAVIRR